MRPGKRNAYDFSTMFELTRCCDTDEGEALR
jgi:hypothetical protein